MSFVNRFNLWDLELAHINRKHLGNSYTKHLCGIQLGPLVHRARRHHYHSRLAQLPFPGSVPIRRQLCHPRAEPARGPGQGWS